MKKLKIVLISFLVLLFHLTFPQSSVSHSRANRTTLSAHNQANDKIDSILVKKSSDNQISIVNSLNDLRHLNPFTNYSIYYLTESGKEGNWYYDASDSSSSDNAGTILVTTTGKRLKRKIMDSIQSRWFMNGDGTDDTEGMVNALKASELNTLPLFFTKGTYKLSNWSNSINNFTKINLKGEDAKTVRIIGKYTNTNIDFIHLSEAAVCQLQGIGFEGWNHVIHSLKNVEELKIYNCYFTNNRGYGIHLYEQFDKNHTPTSSIGTADISHNLVENSLGFEIRCAIQGSVIIHDNQLKNVIRNSKLFPDNNGWQVFGILVGGSDNNPTSLSQKKLGNIIVSNNIIDGIHNDSPVIKGQEDVNTIAIAVLGINAIVTDNIIKNLTTAHNEDGEGIYTKLDGGIISNNILYNAVCNNEFSAAIALKGVYSPLPTEQKAWSRNLIVHHNVLIDTVQTRGSGITSWGGDNIQVDNNIVSGFTVIGIQMGANINNGTLQNIRITNNSIRNVTAATVGFRIIGSVIENIRVENNDFSNIQGIPTEDLNMIEVRSYSSYMKNIYINNNVINTTINPSKFLSTCQVFYISYGTYADNVQLINNTINLSLLNTETSKQIVIFKIAKGKEKFDKLAITGNKINIPSSNFTFLNTDEKTTVLAENWLSNAELKNNYLNNHLYTIQEKSKELSESAPTIRKGKSVQSGTGSSIFVIPHSLGTIPTFFEVQKGSADTLGDYYLSADDTNITVTYSVAPPKGTNNLTFVWLVSK